MSKHIKMEDSVSSKYVPPFCAPNVVTVKLSGRDTYTLWKTQMSCLLESYDMLDFINKENTSVLGGDFKRIDALIKGWILGSISQETLKYVVKPNTHFTSKGLWDKLHSIYGPPVQDIAEYDDQERNLRAETINQETEEEKKLRDEKERRAVALYIDTLAQNFERIESMCKKKIVSLKDKITINGNTALHVAVGTQKNRDFLQKMLNLAKQDNQPLNMKNSEGSTPLHVAAIVDNIEAARMLVKEDETLLYERDVEDQTPVARALSNMNKHTYVFLSDQYFKRRNMRDDELDDIGGCELVANIISSKDYGSALDLVSCRIDRFLSRIDSVLMAIAQNFPNKLNFWERMVYRLRFFEVTVSEYHFKSLNKFKFIETLEKKEKNYNDAIDLLNLICLSIKYERLPRPAHHYYNNAILEATRQNAVKVVKKIVHEFPNAIWSTNEDGHNIIQYAVTNRSEKVYNLLFQMSEHKNTYRTIKDHFGNNLLHLAARLAPSNKLNPISGAALQLQFELQWFKEVERFVCPLNVNQKNLFGETPQMVFTKQHKDLVIDGEKWIKETAQSYTITAALITTIVFAAAITVPGGNIQDSGSPVFAKKHAFTIFAVSDTISLFTCVTSLLMFLSVLTARFSEQDFLWKLPTKLIIGLTTLFISTTAMLIAFGATLFLMFCDNNQNIIIPIVILTCLPITCFASLQFPLINDLVSSTYCRRGTFGKKSNEPFY